ncbi:MAG TPA: hypothetical protein VMI34_06285 [Candidatus Bathyarchaeia archaeon]|nr:hypothetical protein [Candidatus Bathyarchaeia archaeon]
MKVPVKSAWDPDDSVPPRRDPMANVANPAILVQLVEWAAKLLAE